MAPAERYPLSGRDLICAQRKIKICLADIGCCDFWGLKAVAGVLGGEDLALLVLVDVGIDLSGHDAAVAQQVLDVFDVYIFF